MTTSPTLATLESFLAAIAAGTLPPAVKYYPNLDEAFSAHLTSDGTKLLGKYSVITNLPDGGVILIENTFRGTVPIPRGSYLESLACGEKVGKRPIVSGKVDKSFLDRLMSSVFDTVTHTWEFGCPASKKLLGYVDGQFVPIGLTTNGQKKLYDGDRQIVIVTIKKLPNGLWDKITIA